MSLFLCPLCGKALTDEGRGLRCDGGHCFDRAKEGYVHLLPVGQKNSKAPGDDKGMVAARRAFLDKDFYAPLRRGLQELALQLTGREPVILDAGCGEGYYTAGIRQTLLDAGKSPRMAGIDISKFSVQKAAKRYSGIEFAVGSVYRLPVPDASMDLLINVFSPLAIEEFHRVLKPGGYFIYVVPAAMHLWEMKEVLYDKPYPNEEKETSYPGFVYDRIVPVEFTLHLPGQENIQALFDMTPYAWKTPRTGKDRLAALSELDCRAAFHIHVYKKAEG